MRPSAPRPLAIRLAAVAAGAVALSALVVPPPVFAQDIPAATEGVPPGADVSAIATDPEIAEAVAEAAESGHEVEIESLATDSSEAFATPDGTFVEHIALEPYQAQTSEGDWEPIDNTLVEATDGTFVPANADTGLVLSGGGGNTLASITDVHGRSVTYSWPEVLPAPTVSGEVATYAEVMPDVDLKVRATNSGFAKVIEVKTPEAAAAVASVQMGVVLDGFTAAIGETGALEISDYEGNVVYGGPTPLMWDSTVANEEVGDSEDISWAPSTFALSADVTAEYSDGVLTLSPDAAMLADPEAVYPIRIDPEVVKVDSSAWAMISDYSAYRNRSYYNGGSFEKDPNGTARLGRAWDDYQGDMEQTWRLAFEFNTAKFRGKDIIDANLRMTMTYSWMRSCSGISATADLYELDAGNLKNWTWNNQSGDWGSKIASRSEGIASGCGAPRELWTDVTDYVQEVAATKDKKIQFGLRSSSEDCGAQCPSFRRFGPEKVKDGHSGFYLSVEYNTPPNKPGSFTIDGQSCTAGKTVKLGAAVSWTVTAKLSDNEGDVMSGILTWKNQDTGASHSQTLTGAADNKRATWTVNASELTGQTYTATVAAKDKRATGGSSGGCTVLVDSIPPEPPTVVSTDYPADGDPHGSVGKTGRFTIHSTSSDTARYGWSLQDAPGENTVRASSLGAAVTIAFDPPTSGTLTLSAWAIDEHGNPSSKTSYTFTVGAASSPVGHWKLDEMEGTTASDWNYPGYAGDVNRPLALDGPAWAGGSAADAANDRLDYLTFDGDDDIAATASSVIDTNVSYTVSSWVRIHQTDVDYTIASQDGNINSGFMLKYDGESHKFLFVTCNLDTRGSDLACPSAGSNKVTAEAGVWYHVTGVYDYGNKQIRLYVNGQHQSTTSVTAVFDANGPFVVGRDLYEGVKSTYFAGDIDEVKVWDRIVSTGEIERLGQHTEGVWDFETIDTGNFPDLSGAGNDLQGSTVELVEGIEGMAAGFNGSSSTATTRGQVLDTSADFTIGGWVRLDRAGRNMNFLSQDGTIMAPFYFGYREDNGTWQFNATNKDAATGITWKRIESSSPAEIGEWTHLTVVYRAPFETEDGFEGGTVDLYVNGEPQAHGTGFDLWNATGKLRVGSVWYQGGARDYWAGAIDSVSVNTGAFDDQQVAILADQSIRQTHSELVTGDFNDDGIADALTVVESNDQYSDIYLLTGDGSGRYTRSADPVFESDVLNLDEYHSWHLTDAVWRSGDINGDGRDDLVVAVPGDDRFEVWALTACGPRDRICTQSGSLFNSSDLTRLELLAEDGWQLSDTQIQIEDLTGDRADDLVLLRGDGLSAYSIWSAKFDTADRGFTDPVQTASGTGDSRMLELATGDFDGNGCGDVVEIRTGSDNSADFYIRYNNLSGGLCSASLPTPGLAEAVLALNTPDNWRTERDRVTVADFTGDGLPDFAAAYRFNNRIRLQVVAALPDQGGFATNTAWGYSSRCTGCASDLTQWAHVDLAGGDVDGDGIDDLLTLRAGVDGDIGAMWTRISTGAKFAAPAPTWADATTCFGVEGDVNGDGHKDAVLPYSSYAAGGAVDSGAFWFIDGATGAASIVHQNVAGLEGGSEAGDLFGHAVALYDANGDGCSDVAVGTPGENGIGYVHVLYGSPGGGSGVDLDTDYLFSQGTAGIPGANEAGDEFGFSVAASNLTDGTPVLVIGVPGEDVQIDTSGAYRDGDNREPEIVNAGALIYIQGNTKAWIDQNSWGSTTAVEAGDQFGYSVATTPTRFITGMPFEDINAADTGSVMVFDHTTTADGQPTLVARIDQDHPTLAVGASPEMGDQLGYAVAAVDYWPSGSGVDAVQTRFAFTTPWEDVSSNTVDNGGMVHLLNLEGASTFTLAMNYIQGQALGDVAEAHDHLSTSVALYNLDPTKQATNATLYLAIGVPDEDYGTGDDDGIVHITPVAAPTADTDTIITDPTPKANGKFGTGLACTGDGFYMTAPGTGTLHRLTWADVRPGTVQTATVIAG